MSLDHFEDTQVVVSLVHKEGKYLLVRRMKGDKLSWVLPGGKVGSLEDDQSACAREVLEETGIVCSPVKKIGQRIHPKTNRNIVYWLCDWLRDEPRSYGQTDPKIFYVAWGEAPVAFKLLGEELYEPVREHMLVSSCDHSLSK